VALLMTCSSSRHVRVSSSDSRRAGLYQGRCSSRHTPTGRWMVGSGNCRKDRRQRTGPQQLPPKLLRGRRCTRLPMCCIVLLFVVCIRRRHMVSPPAELNVMTSARAIGELLLFRVLGVLLLARLERFSCTLNSYISLVRLS
jgi:hypothetical protein